MRKIKKWFYLRKLVQLGAIALLFSPLIADNPVFIGTYLASDFFSLSLADPLAALEVSLSSKTLWTPLLWAVLPLILTTLIFGRVFCSWICPVNTLIELIALIKKPALIPPKAPKIISYLPYLILFIVLVISALISLPVFTTISPIGSLSRAATFGLSAELLLAGFIILAEFFWQRKAWCRIICPVGALYGLIGRWRFLNVGVDFKSCNNCGQCLSNCSMGVSVGSNKPLDAMSCTNCADCLDACPKGASSFKWKFARKGGTANYESFKKPV